MRLRARALCRLAAKDVLGLLAQLPLGPRLVVPISAVIYTGPRRLVFVDLGNGALRPQEVTIFAIWKGRELAPRDGWPAATACAPTDG